MGSDVEDRFAFGRNWQSFASAIDPARIDHAVESLRTILKVDSLQGKRFVDFGSGSGLFSLAAHRLGADVLSVDFDPDSVACTEAIRDQFSQADPPWQVLQGSVLDEGFMASIGKADVVYCWGVVHHTGHM